MVTLSLGVDVSVDSWTQVALPLNWAQRREALSESNKRFCR